MPWHHVWNSLKQTDDLQFPKVQKIRLFADARLVVLVNLGILGAVYQRRVVALKIYRLLNLLLFPFKLKEIIYVYKTFIIRALMLEKGERPSTTLRDGEPSGLGAGLCSPCVPCMLKSLCALFGLARRAHCGRGLKYALVMTHRLRGLPPCGSLLSFLFC